MTSPNDAQHASTIVAAMRHKLHSNAAQTPKHAFGSPEALSLEPESIEFRAQKH